MYVGLEVGAREIDGIAIDDAGLGVDAVDFDAAEPERVKSWTEQASAVAIDSPDRLSTGPHTPDKTLEIARKFRNARCAEIGLLKQYPATGQVGDTDWGARR